MTNLLIISAIILLIIFILIVIWKTINKINKKVEYLKKLYDYLPKPIGEFNSKIFNEHINKLSEMEIYNRNNAEIRNLFTIVRTNKHNF